MLLFAASLGRNLILSISLSSDSCNFISSFGLSLWLFWILDKIMDISDDRVKIAVVFFHFLMMTTTLVSSSTSYSLSHQNINAFASPILRWSLKNLFKILKELNVSEVLFDGPQLVVTLWGLLRLYLRRHVFQLQGRLYLFGLFFRFLWFKLLHKVRRVVFRVAVIIEDGLIALSRFGFEMHCCKY